MPRIKRYALGLDFGTESVRALAVDINTGEETAQSVVCYPHGVITSTLPETGQTLPPDFALQHPEDYLNSCIEAIAHILKKIPARKIAGIGVDFTACTILPIKKDGTPLMKLPEFADNPHAWVKLWKHHAAQGEADRINELARRRSERFLRYYGGLISSEWMLPKCWEIARRGGRVFDETDIFIDAGDWIVHQLTGEFCRNSCAAGYKGLWSEELGFPSRDFMGELDPSITNLDDKWLKNITNPGTVAGKISEKFSSISGLAKGTPVSAATIDAHSGVPGMGIAKEGPMCIIMGTSSCHMVLSKQLRLFDGYAGVVKNGIIEGFYGYESGQSAVGDVFAWFARDFLGRTGDTFSELTSAASELTPGSGGLISLDWMNGNRSVLMNAGLSGMIMGLTLQSRADEVFRSLIEATAFGTKIIVDSYLRGGVPVNELVVCGGLVKNPLIMQIYADVMNLPVQIAASSQAVALGAAMFGAMAASGDTGPAVAEDIIRRMSKPPSGSYSPDYAAVTAYQELFEIYKDTHDHFGREHTDLMKRLKRFQTKQRQ